MADPASIIGIVGVAVQILGLAGKGVIGLNEQIAKARSLSPELRKCSRIRRVIEQSIIEALRDLEVSVLDTPVDQIMTEQELVIEKAHYKKLWGDGRYYIVKERLEMIHEDLNVLRDLEKRYFHGEIESLTRFERLATRVRFSVSADLAKIRRLRDTIQSNVDRLAADGHNYRASKDNIHFRIERETEDFVEQLHSTRREAHMVYQSLANSETTRTMCRLIQLHKPTDRPRGQTCYFIATSSGTVADKGNFKRPSAPTEKYTATIEKDVIIKRGEGSISLQYSLLDLISTQNCYRLSTPEKTLEFAHILALSTARLHGTGWLGTGLPDGLSSSKLFFSDRDSELPFLGSVEDFTVATKPQDSTSSSAQSPSIAPVTTGIRALTVLDASQHAEVASTLEHSQRRDFHYLAHVLWELGAKRPVPSLDSYNQSLTSSSRAPVDPVKIMQRELGLMLGMGTTYLSIVSTLLNATGELSKPAMLKSWIVYTSTRSYYL